MKVTFANPNIIGFQDFLITKVPTDVEFEVDINPDGRVVLTGPGYGAPGSCYGNGAFILRLPTSKIHENASDPKVVSDVKHENSDLVNISVMMATPELYNDTLKPKTSGSIGVDLRITEDINIASKQGVLVGTGIRVAIPEGYGGFIYIRSSVGSQGVSLANDVGVIDPDYRGELLLSLFNHSNFALSFKRGDRVAQLVINQLPRVKYTLVQKLDDTVRGEGGFGHTGKN